jgi:Bacteriocin-protection, YdeI or OmpD-Associated
MMPAGDGSFYLYLRGIVRTASNSKIGDRVVVDMSFDKTYRAGPTYPMPGWFSSELKKHAKAKKAWQALIPSRKKEILRYFAALESSEAKARNLKKAIEVLSGGQARFMARTWRQGK